MGRRRRLVDRMTIPETSSVIVVPGIAYAAALELAGGDRRRIEVRPPTDGIVAEVIVHNRPRR